MLIAMTLEPFVAVDGVPFTLGIDELLRRKGTPGRRERNEVGLHAFDYGRVVYRFQDSGRLEEVTVDAPVVTLDGVAVPFAMLAAFVRTQDGQAFERAGFLVSPRYGLAFDPRERCWVTALAAHCLPQWRCL